MRPVGALRSGAGIVGLSKRRHTKYRAGQLLVRLPDWVWRPHLPRKGNDTCSPNPITVGRAIESNGLSDPEAVQITSHEANQITDHGANQIINNEPYCYVQRST